MYNKLENHNRIMDTAYYIMYLYILYAFLANIAELMGWM